jgi:hypothetical protein
VATRAYRMRPVQRTYIMTDVLEDTTGAEIVIGSCLFAMEPQESAAFAFLICDYSKGYKNRKWRVHPMNAVRYRDGNFYTFYAPLRKRPVERARVMDFPLAFKST